jgi:hypothetical protein
LGVLVFGAARLKLSFSSSSTYLASSLRYCDLVELLLDRTSSKSAIDVHFDLQA